MPWKDAKEEAIKWIDSLDLPQDLTGHSIDLRELGRGLPFEGTFKEMVLRAAFRMLKKRKAEVKKLSDYEDS
jgi:hypothetical protein